MKDIIRKIIRENMVELNYVEDYLPNVDLRNKKKISNDVIPLELLNDIQTAAERAGVTVTIMFAKSNHKKNTKSGTVSRHYLSKALDISMINGRAIDEKTRSITDDFVAELEKLGYYRNAEGGNPKSVLWKMRDKSHYDHVHVSNMGGGSVPNSGSDKSNKDKNKKKEKGLTVASPDMLKKLIELLKLEDIKNEDITPFIIKKKSERSPIITSSPDSSLMSKFKKIAGDDYDSFISDVKSLGLDPNIAIRQLHVESVGFSPDVIICKRKSPKGAMGLAQFMPGTWDRYGEGSPCNVSDSLKAYVKFMGVLLKRFPNRPDLAVAAYNSGPNRDAYKKAYNNDLDLTSIKSQIPSETYNYYKKIFQV